MTHPVVAKANTKRHHEYEANGTGECGQCGMRVGLHCDIRDNYARREPTGGWTIVCNDCGRELGFMSQPAVADGTRGMERRR